MTPSQLAVLMEKYEEIRQAILRISIKPEAKTEDEEDEEDILDSVSITKMRDAFFHQLEAKTGWGRNEIKEIFEISIKSTL